MSCTTSRIGFRNRIGFGNRRGFGNEQTTYPPSRGGGRLRGAASFVGVAVLVGGLLGSTLTPARAAAQCADCEQLDAGIKGTVGLGLVGAELGLVTPAIFGAEDTWMYIVFPIVGAAGGAAAGYFLLDEPAGDGESEASLIALAAGMALAVPSLVLTLSLTSYDPGDESSPLQQPQPGEDAEFARPGGLLRYSEGAVAMGLPDVHLRRSYTARDIQQFGAQQRTELHVPVVRGQF